MVGPALRRMTLSEFLSWDDGTDTRFELVDGQVVAMAPPLVAHALIVANLVGLIRARLRSGCRVFGEAGIAPAAGRDVWYQVDVAVSCTEQEASARYVHEPTLLIEVLSPSTTGHDHDVKAPDYRAMASVREILLVSSQRRHVVLWRREGDHWVVQDVIGDAAVALDAVAVPLALADVYEGVSGV